MPVNRIVPVLAFLFCIAACSPDGENSAFADWPTYRGDGARSGVMDEYLSPDNLDLAWTHQSHAPIPAWEGPARWDAYNRKFNLPSMRNYDFAYHPVADGDAMYFGSSFDDTIYCLDAISGDVRWRFVTGGPVIMAPTLWSELVLVGSDDGTVYALHSKSGKLKWSFSPRDEAIRKHDGDAVHDRVLNDGRLISFWPIRTGVAVQNGQAIFAASLLPWKPAYLCSIDANTGQLNQSGFFKELTDHTFEGSMALTADTIIAPQGRVPPVLFSAKTGDSLGQMKGGGGVFAVVTPDQKIIFGDRKNARESDSTPKAATIAAFPDARSLVVSGDVAGVLTPYEIAAIQRSDRKILWKKPIENGTSLALVPNCLIVGTESDVRILNPDTGEELWKHSCTGKVLGLAVSNGSLFATTDRGAVHCFRSMSSRDRTATDKTGLTTSQEQIAPARKVTPLPKISPEQRQGLIGCWTFHPTTLRVPNLAPDEVFKSYPAGTVVADQGQKHSGELVGTASFETWDGNEALKFDGKQTRFTLSVGPTAKWLPKKTMTTSAWVRVDRPQAWGAVLSAVRDNGSDEQGWLLGFLKQKFVFGLKGQSGKAGLSYVQMEDDFQLGAWYHIVGTYDGTEQKLFVNGELIGTSKSQSGDIQYPETLFVDIGAYHDENELFPMAGQIKETRLYDVVLSNAQIQSMYQGEQKRFPSPTTTADRYALAVGPTTKFTNVGEAEIRFQLKPGMTADQKIELRWNGKSGDKTSRRADVTVASDHSATATFRGLSERSLYEYSIFVDGALFAGPWELDTHFNYEWPKYTKTDSTKVSAENTRIMSAVAQDRFRSDQAMRGIAVLVGDDVNLAMALHEQTEHKVLMLIEDGANIDAVRAKLVAADVNGSGITAIATQQVLKEAPSGFANLVIVPKGKTLSPELWDLVRPAGGCAIVAVEVQQKISELANIADQEQIESCTIFIRDRIDGSGNWSHMYGDPANRHFADEELGGVTSSKELQVQWLGRPGPRYQSDRENRKPSPLYANGRLFIQGLHRIIAIDAHNGLIQWAREIPTMVRFNVPRDCSNWCTDGEFLYVAIDDQCWKFSAKDGEVQHRYPIPEKSTPQDWGFLATVDDQIIGSTNQQAAAYVDWDGPTYWYDQTGGPLAAKVVSDQLFSVGKTSESMQWSYPGGVVLNATITITDEKVYFLETNDVDLLAGKAARLQDAKLWKSLELVALDLKTGEEKWRGPINGMDGTTAISMTISDEKLIVNASSAGKFSVHCCDATASGKVLWNSEFKWEANHHGKHLARPAVVGGKVFVRPVVLDLETGEKLTNLSFPSGHTCASYTLCKNAMFLRAGDLTMWSPDSGEVSRWPRIRTDCWISLIPAGGMLLVPEGGGGCSCGKWMESSLGFGVRKSAP